MKENLYTPFSIRTFTGKYVNVLEPTEDMINISDIAHSLSQQCRFNGHLKEFYSVAQHSIYCYNLVKIEHRLAALLHDSSEAYLCDIPKPIKKSLLNYHEIEDKLMKVIANKFGFEYPLHEDVKRADEIALVNEWHCLMLQDTDAPFIKSNETIKDVKDKFLEFYHNCKKK